MCSPQGLTNVPKEVKYPSLGHHMGIFSKPILITILSLFNVWVGKHFRYKAQADRFLIDRKTGGIGCQFLVDEEKKGRCVNKIEISGNRIRISGVG